MDHLIFFYSLLVQSLNQSIIIFIIFFVVVVATKGGVHIHLSIHTLTLVGLVWLEQLSESPFLL